MESARDIARLTAKMDMMMEDLKELKGDVKALRGQHDQEVALCVFHPARQDNGKQLLGRVDGLEATASQNGLLLRIILALGAPTLLGVAWDKAGPLLGFVLGRTP